MVIATATAHCCPTGNITNDALAALFHQHLDAIIAAGARGEAVELTRQPRGAPRPQNMPRTLTAHLPLQQRLPTNRQWFA